MSLRDDVAGFATVRGPACRVRLFLDSLDDDVRSELEEAMRDRTLMHTAFQRWALERHGERVSDQSWSRHRACECACERR